MTTRNLLVELFVEELPPKALQRLGEAFAGEIAHALAKAGLVTDAAVQRRTVYASPRRLAVHVPEVLARAEDRRTRQKLVPVKVGLDADGQPTATLLKKLLGLNLGAQAVPSLQRAMDGKTESLFADVTLPGVTLDEGLQIALDEALAKLPIPKLMSYQLEDGWTSVHFVRPAHGLVALHGDRVVKAYALGLTAGRCTQGHRFEAALPTIELRDADGYAAQLRDEGAVIASFDERREDIAAQLARAAQRAGGTPVEDAALLDEVTALVERPNVLVGRFDAAFLEVPQECLILTMKANQKYFPLLDAAGRLTNRFLIVANIRPADPSAVIEGNERVVRPRLADAKFFFDQDRKRTLASRVDGLAKVVYHGRLGSQRERVERVRAIARGIAPSLGGTDLTVEVDRAALLAKADLLTDMVAEFPELQGVMGGYYARHDGESEAVALAVEDHYRPRFAGDELPRGEAALVLAVADKLETLVGMFGIGEKPTGDRDPYALRRHALGVIRMLAERLPALTLQRAVDIAIASPVWPATLVRPGPHEREATVPLRGELLQFLADRLAVLMRDEGYSAAEVEAVLADDKFWWVGEVSGRLRAVRAFAALPESASLAAANKRVANILRKAEAEAASAQVDVALLKEPAELALYESLQALGPMADAAFERHDYTVSLQALATLKAPVDAFFDHVMVNVDDPRLRANRLGLLATLHAAMNRVADLSKLAA